MCGICGIVNFQDANLSDKKYDIILKNMTEKLNKRGPDAEGYLQTDTVIFGYRRLAVIDIANGSQPMTRVIDNNRYTIVYNGELYNTVEIKEELEKKGYKHTTNCDTETLLLGYICFGKEILQKIIGIFAFCIYDESKQKVFFARDNFGVKPFYYTQINNNFIFASEQKSILASEQIKAQIDKQGLQELFSLNPIKTPGVTLFKDIFELKSGECGEFSNEGYMSEIYYKIEAKPHTDSKRKTIKKVRKLVINSVTSQLVSDVPICTLLSGGLDSSIITAIASKTMKRRNEQLNTYSIDFLDNKKYFKKSEYQPTEDTEFIRLMTKKFKTKHNDFLLSSK